MVTAAAVRQEIEQRNREVMAAFNRGDAAAAAALYAEDAKVLPAGGPMVNGRQAIRQFLEGARAMGMQEIAMHTQEVESHGDLALEIGTYRVKVQPPGGAATTDDGKYVVVWKRQASGPWQLAVDIWNS